MTDCNKEKLMFIIELRFIDIRKTEKHLHAMKYNVAVLKIIEVPETYNKNGLLVHTIFILLFLKVYHSVTRE